MKTAQIMVRKFDFGSVQQNHKTGFFCMNDILSVGNNIRFQKGLRPYDKVVDYTRSIQFKEFMDGLVYEANNNPNDMIYLPKGGDSPPFKPADFITVKKGRNGSTWGYPLIAIDMAMWMDASFKVKMLNAVFDKLLQLRDSGGDAFKSLNITLDEKFDIGRKYWEYAKVAKFVQRVVFGVEDNERWNLATQDELHHRDRLLTRIEAACQFGKFRSIDELLSKI